MKLLAFDTATEACTAALWLDGQVLERLEHRSQHSEHLLAMIDNLLVEAGLVIRQLDAIAFGRGPGSFTGLRIGAGIAQGLAFAADLPVVPVSSLAALAQGVPANRVLSALDARMHQIYWGAYVRNAHGVMELLGEEQVLAPGQVTQPEGSGWTGAGSGWDAYAAAIEPLLSQCLVGRLADRVPLARGVAELALAGFHSGKTVSAAMAQPVYIRDDVAAKRQTPA